MLVERSRLSGLTRQVVIRFFFRLERAAIEERNPLVEHACVTDLLHIQAGREWQPQKVVGKMRPHTTTGGRMPPMLNVSLLKLMARSPEQMIAQQPRLGMRQGHDILQLITKSERAAGLIKATTSPQAARQGLV